MSAIAVLLIALGVADFGRRATSAVWPPLLAGPVTVLVCAALCALWHMRRHGIARAGGRSGHRLGMAVRAQRAQRQCARRTLGRFGSTLGLLAVMSGWSSPADGVVARWSAWVHLPLGDVTPTRLLMLVGVVLVQFATANQLVRLVLGSVGAVRPPVSRSRRTGSRAAGCWVRWNAC